MQIGEDFFLMVGLDFDRGVCHLEGVSSLFGDSLIDPVVPFATIVTMQGKVMMYLVRNPGSPRKLQLEAPTNPPG